MSRFLHSFLQGLLIITQVVNVSALPTKWQPIIVGVTGLLQAILAIMNHDPVNR